MNTNWALFLIAVATLWNTTGNLRALASPLVIGTQRLLVGAATLVVFALWRGKWVDLRSWPWKTIMLETADMAVYH